MTPSTRERLLAMVHLRVSPAAGDWLEQAIEDSAAATRDDLSALYTRIATRVGTGGLSRQDADVPDSRQADIDAAFDRWTVTETGFRSRSVNSWLLRETLKGRVKTTIAAGRLVYG